MGICSVDFSTFLGTISCHVDAFSVVHPFSRPREKLSPKSSQSLVAPESSNTHSRMTSPQSSSLPSSASDQNESSKARILGKRPPSMLRNEFSRTYRPKSILPIPSGDDMDYGSGGGDNGDNRSSGSNTKSKTRKRHQRQLGTASHEMTVTATKEECDALAERFDLSRLDSLEADVRIMPCIVQQQTTAGKKGSRVSKIGSDSFNSNSNVVDVEGTIKAHVQHVCVRSGDEFEMDVEFPFYSTVFPISGDENSLNDNINRGRQDDDTGPKKKNKNKKSKRSKNASLNSGSGGNIVVDLNDVFDLQAAIKASEATLRDDDGLGDIDAAAAAIPFEDEAVYCTFPDLTLDVGELVAQTFYTQLDPYPVKDKTDDGYEDIDDDDNDDDDGPVELYSITG